MLSWIREKFITEDLVRRPGAQQGRGNSGRAFVMSESRDCGYNNTVSSDYVIILQKYLAKRARVIIITTRKKKFYENKFLRWVIPRSIRMKLRTSVRVEDLTKKSHRAQIHLYNTRERERNQTLALPFSGRLFRRGTSIFEFSSVMIMSARGSTRPELFNLKG